MRCTVIVDGGEKSDGLAELGQVVVPGDTQAHDPVDVVVHWGRPVGSGTPAGARLTFNRPEAQALAADGPLCRRLWRLAGLNVRVRGPRLGYYRVCLVDLKPVGVFRVVRVRTRRRRRGRGRWGLGLQRVGRRGKVKHEMVLAARRALNVLRLDFGVVDVGINARREPYVMRVTPAPSPQSRLGRYLASALRERILLLARRNFRVVLGADPEFTLLDRRTRRLVPVSRYLKANGRLGLDRQRMRGSKVARPIGEVRPVPDDEPDRLVGQIQRLLGRLHRRIRHRHYAWIAGSGPGQYPTGGHIHLSGIPLSAGLLRALDVYLAIPFLLVEQPLKARRRRRKYGGLGDFRPKPWGFEYRTVPSWLVAPRYARAAFVLTKLIAEHWPVLRRDPFLEPDYQRAFYRCEKAAFFPVFRDLWGDIMSLPDYDRYREQLQPLTEVIQNGHVWSEGLDFRRHWGVRSPRRRRRRRR